MTRPPEAGIVGKPIRQLFKSGSQAASAESMVRMSEDPDEELENRRAAEALARSIAEQKYVAEFHEPIDWPRANILVSHTTLSVVVYINVEI